MVAYKHNKGQTLTTDTAEPADRSFISHILLDADACAAADTDGIITIELGEEEQTIEEGLKPCPPCAASPSPAGLRT